MKALLRWYFLEAIAALFLLSALTDAGGSRLMSLVVGLLAGTVAIRLRYGDRAGRGSLAKLIQVVGGGGAALAGTGLTLGGVWLALGAGYGLLAALVVVPLGAGLAILGGSIMRIGLQNGEEYEHPRPLDLNDWLSRVEPQRGEPWDRDGSA